MYMLAHEVMRMKVDTTVTLVGSVGAKGNKSIFNKKHKPDMVFRSCA